MDHRGHSQSIYLEEGKRWVILAKVKVYLEEGKDGSPWPQSGQSRRWCPPSKVQRTRSPQNTWRQEKGSCSGFIKRISNESPGGFLMPGGLDVLAPAQI